MDESTLSGSCEPSRVTKTHFISHIIILTSSLEYEGGENDGVLSHHNLLLR